MTEEDREALKRRYAAAVHARQSAVESKGDRSLTPKHMRVGIDSAMSEQGGLVQLLIQKGIVTDDEYLVAMCEAAEREAESWAVRVHRTYNLPDTVSFG